MRVREYKRYYHTDEAEITILYEFDTEKQMIDSGLLNDKHRTTCFESSGKYYVGGHFEKRCVQ